MVNRLRHPLAIPVLAVLVVVSGGGMAVAQQVGSIRGTTYDADFDAPLAGVEVTIAETDRTVTASDQGTYVISDVQPGEYTLVFTRAGYIREVEGGVVVNPGQLTEVNATLSGDFTDMQEFVVQDLQLDAGSEAALLDLRFEVPQVLDSIGSDFLSRAGASDAAAGLRLVSGATTTADGFAAVRGLPPRFVSTQLNGFVLPSADPDTRAVQLDLFPSEVIESIQVSKSFTPDQQGAASGGAVNIVTKSVPDENFIKISSGVKVNSQRPDSGEFLKDARGDVPFFGSDSARDLPGELTGLVDNTEVPPSLDPLPGDQFGSPAPQFGDAPIQYDMTVTGGLQHEFDTGVKIGGVATMFWDQDVKHDDERINDDREALVADPGLGLIPDVDGTNSQKGLTDASLDGGEQILTSLFDETQSEQEVTWGGLATVGLEAENHKIGATFMFTRIATSTVTIAEDTRGKLAKFPGHDPTDVDTPGGVENTAIQDGFGGDISGLVGDDLREVAPFRRLETQEFLVREVESLQFNGEHTLPVLEDGLDLGGIVKWLPPVFDWHYADSRSSREEPGTTVFDSKFKSPSQVLPGFAPVAEQNPITFTTNDLSFSNVIFRDIEEESEQLRLNLELPFEQWEGEAGFVRIGLFDDTTNRDFRQNTFALQGENALFRLFSPFDDLRLSEAVGSLDEFTFDPGAPPSPIFGIPDGADPGNIEPSPIDFALQGQQDIEAWYWMVDFPLTSFLNVIGGVRFEDTTLSTDLQPDGSATGLFIDEKILQETADKDPTFNFSPGTPTSIDELERVGIPVDSNIDRQDVLPSLGFALAPLEGMKIRGSYAETIAKPTFRELTPTSQQLFVGETPFVGNPSLKVSEVENWDLRVDYRPQSGSLLSLSYFKKNLVDPIQTISQTQGTTNVTIPVNLPSGTIEGWEFEARQDIGRWFQPLRGLTLGGNLTILDTEVQLRENEKDKLVAAGVPQSSIEMTNAPEFLANLFLTYDLEETGTQASLFYTIRGDTLIASPSIGGVGNSSFTPAVYETQFDTLNLTLNQKVGENINLSFSAKNLTNPDVETVYRSEFIPGGDVVKTRSSSGIDFSFGISANFTF